MLWSWLIVTEKSMGLFVIVSDANRERENSNPQKNSGTSWAKQLLNTSLMLWPLSHWTYGRGARHKLHVAALCGGLSWIPNDSLSLNGSYVAPYAYTYTSNQYKQYNIYGLGTRVGINQNHITSILYHSQL